MAQNRWVSTNFWKDSYVTELDPIEKLLFLYLLTNPRTNIAGIYEISIREMAFDTGIDKDMIEKIIKRFQEDKKVYFSKNWMTLVNWLRHQQLNPKMHTGARAVMDNVPIWYRQELLAIGKPMDSLYIGFDTDAHSILFNSILFNLISFNQPLAVDKKENKEIYHGAFMADKQQIERATKAAKRKGSFTSTQDLDVNDIFPRK